MSDRDVFLAFSERFHQDIFDLYPSPESTVQHILRRLKREDLESIRNYLSEEIADDGSSAKSAWNSSRASFLLLSSVEAERFFRLVQDEIDNLL